MCLKLNRIIKSKKDLVVYKLLREIKYGEYESITFCYNYKIGKCFTNFGRVNISNYNNTVHGGVFHCNRRKKDLIKSIKAKEWGHYNIIYVIVRCIIPASTEYYSGVSIFCSEILDTTKSVGARVLKLEKIVYREKF